MEANKKEPIGTSKQQPAASHRSPNTDENIEKAYEQAEQDIEKDPDFFHSETEDLDEGELARLGKDKNKLA